MCCLPPLGHWLRKEKKKGKARQRRNIASEWHCCCCCHCFDTPVPSFSLRCRPLAATHQDSPELAVVLGAVQWSRCRCHRCCQYIRPRWQTGSCSCRKGKKRKRQPIIKLPSLAANFFSSSFSPFATTTTAVSASRHLLVVLLVVPWLVELQY